MKVSIIGGGGRVGSCAAFALQSQGVVSEIQLLDADRKRAAGEALDLLHGTAFCADQRIYEGDYERAANSDIFIITAGLRRKPDESRLDLIHRNTDLFRQILQSIRAAGHLKSAKVFVISNPVDILTHLAIEELDLPFRQIFGLGTMLDTARFCSLIADALGLAATQVRALILGEHGDSMLPIWSSASVNGFLLTAFDECNPSFQNAIFERTRRSGAEVIKQKGGAGWAVGVAIADVISAIALDRKQLLPISSFQKGAYGIRDICLSVPSILGKNGVEKHVEIKLWPKEQTALQHSASALKDILHKVHSDDSDD